MVVSGGDHGTPAADADEPDQLAEGVGEEPGQLIADVGAPAPPAVEEGEHAIEPEEPGLPAAGVEDAPAMQTHAGRARRSNFGVPPERLNFSAQAPVDPQSRKDKRKRRRRRGPRGPRPHRRKPSEKPAAVRHSKLPPRRGMQPHLPDGVEPVVVAAAWAFLGEGTTAAGDVRADMERLARVASEERPVDVPWREPNPKSVREALSRPDAAEWQRAIDEEVASCLEFGVWTPVELPHGKQALPSHFVLERKRCGRYKARLVAGGHRQTHGLDFDETYAPVCSFRTLRMVLAVAAHEDLELRQFDIRTAFLNGELREEVYIRQPNGARLGRAGQVLRLYRALYGLRQAGRAWNKRLEAALLEKGFVQSDSEPSSLDSARRSGSNHGHVLRGRWVGGCPHCGRG